MKKMCKVIFIILIQLILIYNCGCFRYTPIRNKIFKYLTGVVAHICDQTGWNSMENDSLIWESKNIGRIKELLNHKVDKYNFLYIFSYIVNIFNYKYIGILQTFVEHVDILIEECEKYLTAQSFDNFINCTTLLEIGMKKSTVMFDRIYQVMWFLSYLDVKRVFVKVAGNPYTVVDEVYLVKHFIDSIQIKDETGPANNQEEYITKVNEAVLVIFNTKELIKNVTERAISIVNILRALIIIPQRLDLKLNYESEYHSQECIENDFFNFVLNNLNKFYTHTNKIYYDDFNFDILLNPDAYNMDRLIPPQEEPLPLATEVTTLKILVNEGEWKTVDHISIIHHGLVISANRIVRDPVSTMHGFNLKKQYILILLKCRLCEIFSNYYLYLASIVQFCYNEKLKLDKASNADILSYVNCVSNYLETCNTSENFFNKIILVMQKLKDASIWEVTIARVSLSSIEFFLKQFIDTFNNNYLYENIFNYTNNTIAMFMIDKILKNMIKQRILLNKERHAKLLYQKSRCQYIGKSSPFISNQLQTAEENNDFIEIDTLADHKKVCNELITFCKNFIETDFKDLGFDKIF